MRVFHFSTVLLLVGVGKLANSATINHDAPKSLVLENTVNCPATNKEKFFTCETEIPYRSNCEFFLNGTITTENKVLGNNLRFEDCTLVARKEGHCLTLDPKMGGSIDCSKGECTQLQGLFNCSAAYRAETGEMAGSFCKNVTSSISCQYNITDPLIMCNTSKGCPNLGGLYFCEKGNCGLIRYPYSCNEKWLSAITTTNMKNFEIRERDVVYTATCPKALDSHSKSDIWSEKQKTDKSGNDPLIFCKSTMDRTNYNKTLQFSDCYNIRY